jgi:phage-related protein
LKRLPVKAQDKVYKIIEAIETIRMVPSHYLKKIVGVDGLYEARVKLGSNIWRVFCFFDGDKLVILLNGYQKKEQKTSKREIDRAKRLMDEYYDEKKGKK